MTTGFKLGLPLDIPWQRICVTEDMTDRVVCDRRWPPKWNSSIAVFKYRPDDDYQMYPDYDITYLKVTVTITGYQPLDSEIQGTVDWNGVDVSSIDGVTDLLSTYYPCTGAILQVVVGPKKPERVPLTAYPFFMDFEPKKRELYEMATDTKEKQSRSIESLTIGKSSGSTKSQEVLDVDMGSSWGFGMQGSYAGTGGGFNISSSNQGQWGTKSLNSEDSLSTRNTELGTERRETQSFTTQLSQMYHLLDSYHLGTNRAVFFVQPRPHVLEEPSGFVRGPRKVEGIQEFFLVVARPKDAPEWCVSARLDTAHLAETDILDYETRTEVTDLAKADAKTPTRNATPDGSTTREACFFACWDVTYLCYRTNDVDDVVYPAPAGFTITGYSDVVNTHDSHGSSSVTLSPDRKVLTVHAEANGHICFEDSGVCVDCPDEIEKWAGSARRQVQVQLRSIEKTKKVGTRTSLLITTRGLCCCDGWVDEPPKGVVVVDLPHYLAAAPTKSLAAGARVAARVEAAVTGVPTAADAEAEDECDCLKTPPSPIDVRRAIQQANALSDVIRDELTKTVTSADIRPAPGSFLETDLFPRQLEGVLSRTRRGRDLLESGLRGLPDPITKFIAARLKKDPARLTRRDLLRFQTSELVRESGLNRAEVARAKLGALGVPVKAAQPKGEGQERDEGPEYPPREPRTKK
jgi:hypothetical protein